MTEGDVEIKLMSARVRLAVLRVRAITRDTSMCCQKVVAMMNQSRRISRRLQQIDRNFGECKIGLLRVRSLNSDIQKAMNRKKTTSVLSR